MIRSLLLCSSLIAAPYMYGANIAVIDSGLDFQHEELNELIWNNMVEIPDNGIDDDGNGYIDDMRGWNFANQHAYLIDYDDEQFYLPAMDKFLDIQARAMMGQATVGEKKWAQQQIKDRDFVNSFTKYLNYAHGTHVAGIMTKGIQDIKVVDIRIIPGKAIEEEEKNLTRDIQFALEEGQEIGFIREFILKLGLLYMAKANGTLFGEIAMYLDQANVLVANGSFGMGIEQARGIVTPFLLLAGGGVQPSPDLIDEFAVFYLKESRKEQQKAFAKAPNTLFVFAAGNSAVDNDMFPSLPASIGIDNSLAVGASIGMNKLAPFSNFGAMSVDVFAPGVGIRSLAPMDKMMTMSGTSQAAPYVANLAVQVRLMNPSLTPMEVKDIIMLTIDRKGYLEGLAYSEGVINNKRAILAAELSKDLDIREAVKQSRSKIADIVSEQLESEIPLYIGKPFLPSYR